MAPLQHRLQRRNYAALISVHCLQCKNKINLPVLDAEADRITSTCHTYTVNKIKADINSKNYLLTYLLFQPQLLIYILLY